MNDNIRICFVIDSLNVGGANSLTIETVNLLYQYGYDVSLITLFSSNNDFKLIKSIKDKITTFYLNLEEGNHLDRVSKLKNILDNYEIVFSVLENSNFYCSFIKKYLLRKKIFISIIHGFDVGSTEDKYFNEFKSDKTLKYKIKVNYLQKLLFSSYNHFIAVSKSTEEFIKNKYSIPEKKVTVVYHGLNLNNLKISSNDDILIELKTKYNIAENDFVLGYIGRLAYAKGLENLIPSFNRLNHKYKNIKLLIVGDGERKDYLQNLINHFNIQNNCIITGYVCNVSEYYKLLDLFLLPSYAEGLPLSMLEAMYLNVLTVCSDVGGIPEVICNNVNGFIFKSGDFRNMEKIIENIYLNKNIYQHIKDDAKNTVLEKFDLNKNIKYIADLINKYLYA